MSANKTDQGGEKACFHREREELEVRVHGDGQRETQKEKSWGRLLGREGEFKKWGW